MKFKPSTTNAHTLSVEDVLTSLESTPAGLSTAEAEARQQVYGPNAYKTQKQKSAWLILLEQFQSTIVYLLLLGAAASAYFHE